MSRRIRRLGLLAACLTALVCLFGFGADAAQQYTYPSMPSDWQNVQVTVGTGSNAVTMPFTRYPSGSIFDPEKCYMTVEEAKDYGLNLKSDLYLRGWECVGFARYAYSALFYKYPQDATIDNSLAYSYANSYAYRNMIEEVLGTKTLSGGYSEDTLKKLITSCQPGAVMRCGGHSMVVMAIYDDGMLIYDANFSSDNEVNVRAYTWKSFVSSLGSREMTALHMPAYYPGYSYSSGDNNYYPVDTSTAGQYEVYDCSYLNVRNLPATTGGIVGSLQKGAVVTVLGTYGDWAKIEYNGSHCWVHTDYLKPYAMKVSVTFDANGGTASFTSKTYTAGASFGSMPTATKTSRTLVGWSDGSKTYTESSIVPSVSSLSLKAKWCVLTYQDVSEDAWYASNVENAYSMGLIAKDTLFHPEMNASRAHMVTVLGREYEREYGVTLSASGSSVFSDVPAGSYYDRYVAWGYENGIVKGIGDNKFAPDGDVTREQIAEFLYRMAIFTGKTTRQEGDMSLLGSFKDTAKISDYAKSAMCWAVQNGILKGDDRSCLNPGSSATRAEMIAMLSRYISYAESAQAAAPVVEKTKVTFDANGGTVTGASGEYVTGGSFGSLPTPTKTNRTFLGWYSGDTRYTADSQVPSGSLTLTARWGVLNYDDVAESDWYVSYLEKAYTCGLVDGSGSFHPQSAVVRSDVVTYLGRSYEWLSGETIPATTAAPFQDVSASEPYAKYVVWGYDNDIVKGIGDNKFDPGSNVTREQIAAFLYRLADKTGKLTGTESDASVLNRFPDGGTTNDYAKEAMSWAVTIGIFSGDDLGNLRPLDSVTYAEIITVMARYIDYMG